MLLVDTSRFARPSCHDRVLLCYAWRHAFPTLPEAVVQEIACHLPPGKLGDELRQLRWLLNTCIDVRGCEATIAIVLCHAERLPAALAEAPQLAELLTPEEARRLAAEPPPTREALCRAAASRCLLTARRLFQEEADALCDESHARSLAAAVSAGSDALIATAAPQARVLVAPDFERPASAGRRGSGIFFHELTFLAVRRLPPHRTAFHAFRVVAATRRQGPDGLADDAAAS